MKDCRLTRELLAKEQSGGLSAPEQAMIHGHLASCTLCRQHADELAGMLSSLGSLHDVKCAPSEAGRAAFLARLKTAKTSQRRKSSVLRASVRRLESNRLRIRRAAAARIMAFAGIAAALLIGIGVWLAMARNADDRGDDGSTSSTPQFVVAPSAARNAPDICELSGRVMVRHAGQTSAAARDQQLHAGDTLETGSDARAALAYADGTRIEVNGGTTLRIGDESLGKRLTLEQGDAFLKVAKQPKGQPMTINPGRPDQVIVVGTAFELSRHGDGTSIKMAEGKVTFGSRSAPVTVVAGQESSVTGDSAPAAPAGCSVASIASWRTVSLPPVANAPEEAPTQPVATTPETTPVPDPAPVQPVPPVVVAPPPAVTPQPDPKSDEPGSKPEQPIASNDNGSDKDKAKDNNKDKDKDKKDNPSTDTKIKPAKPNPGPPIKPPGNPNPNPGPKPKPNK